MAIKEINQRKLKEAADELMLKFPLINEIFNPPNTFAEEQKISVEESRRKYGGVNRGLGGNKVCSFDTIDGNGTVDVYPAAAVITTKSGRTYNSVTLTESDIANIKNCMVKGMKSNR